MHALRRGLFAAAMLAAIPAHADRWLVAEAPAAVAISAAQSEAFRPGVAPAVGFYNDNGWLALGARLRFGALMSGGGGNTMPPAEGRAVPSLGGIATAGLGLRLAPGWMHGAWLEGVAGGGLTGKDIVPAVEAGFGWDFAIGDIDVGPSVRYLSLIEDDNHATLGSANLVLLGVDFRFGKERPAPVVARPPVAKLAARPAPKIAAKPVAKIEPVPAAKAEPVAAPVEAKPAVAAVVLPPQRTLLPALVVSLPAAPPALERDHDQVVDRDQSCEREAQGCKISEHLFVKNDRVVLEDRVLFDSGRARVRSRGREMIAELVRTWAKHPEWRTLTIEGHADATGSARQNLELSQLRADRVRAVFLKLGVEPDRITAVGYGDTRPRDADDSETAYQHNRRVELVIERDPGAHK